jgi:hypothetical protein
MNRIAKMSLFVLALTGLAGLAVFGLPAIAKANDDSNTFSFDVACDCRTGSTLDGGVRASPFMIQGKIFPAGTLPSGTATNDPAQPVHGVASVGDWICRGQLQGSYPPAIAPAYNSTPFALNTQYFILNRGGALTAEGYDIPTGSLLSVTGGIGAFSGASGDIQGTILGTNATGCPNFRAMFRIRPGSLHGASDN